MWEEIIYTLIVALLLVVIGGIYIYSASPSPSSECVKLKMIEPKLKTGDLILLSGKGMWEKAVQRATCCEWSHIGMVVRKPGTSQSIYLYEADMGQSYPDGVRLIPLSDKLSRYRGHRKGVWLSLSTQRDVPFKTLSRIIEEIGKKGMKVRMFEWLLSSSPSSPLFEAVRDEDTVYCSELIADVYMRLGILETGKHPSFYTTASFLSPPLPLRDGFSLKEPIYFEWE